MATIIHNPEAGRFYREDGTVVFEVEKKDGGMRPPNITDCLKNGWYKSVTEILKVLDHPGLTTWKLQHILEIAHENKIMDRETKEQWILRVAELSDEYAALARDRGTEIHAAIENFFRTGLMPDDPACSRACNEIRAHYPNMEIKSEVPFVCRKHGFAGTIDLVIGDKILGDIKTKEISKFDKPYPDMGLQLAAYSLNFHDPKQFSLDQIVVDRDTGETRFFRWGEMWKRTQSQSPDALREAFLCLLRYDMLITKYRNPSCR